MPTVTLSIDARTEARLTQISAESGDPVSRTAARLLERAVRATRPRCAFDAEAIRAAQAEFKQEDFALSDYAASERGQLLVREDSE
jgi:hypothetical protein